MVQTATLQLINFILYVKIAPQAITSNQRQELDYRFAPQGIQRLAVHVLAQVEKSPVGHSTPLYEPLGQVTQEQVYLLQVMLPTHLCQYGNAAYGLIMLRCICQA